MTGLFYLVLLLLVLFAVGFVGYYGWRLARVRSVQRDSDRRLQSFMHEVQSAPPRTLSASGSDPVQPPNARASSEVASSRSLGSGAAGGIPVSEPFEGGSIPGTIGLPSRVCDRRVALRSISSSPVFLRRDRKGEITVQIESRPPMPLTFVLDVRARHALQEAVNAAGVEFGEQWAVLASEDDAGRLVLTRLT